MARGSKRFRELTRRLQQLRLNLLGFLPDPPVSKVSYNDHELDSTRAYVVLAHAEIEAFCEEIASKKVQDTIALYNNRHVVSSVLRRMVAYHVGKHRRSWGEVSAPPQSTIDSTVAAYRDFIKKNHGVKRTNLESILYPLGITDAHLNATWLAQMDSFGVRRGVLAHNSVGATAAPDPLSEYNDMQRILAGLLDLDRKLAQL